MRSQLAVDVQRRVQEHVVEIEPLAPIAHGFTHFKLDIRPLRLRVSALAPHAAESGVMWLPLEEARGAAIPAPVRRILALL